MTKNRRHANSHAREIALQAIYQVEIGQKLIPEVLKWKWLKTPPSQKVLGYARLLIEGIIENKDYNHELLKKHSHKDITQISTIVKEILYIGFWEIKIGELSHIAIINDLLELVRKYDGEESVPFTNAILDSFCKENSTLQKNSKQSVSSLIFSD